MLQVYCESAEVCIILEEIFGECEASAQFWLRKRLCADKNDCKRKDAGLRELARENKSIQGGSGLQQTD